MKLFLQIKIRKYCIILLLLFFLPFANYGQGRVKPDTKGDPQNRETREENVKLKAAGFYNKKSKRSLFFFPFASWNNYDNIQLGAGMFTNPVKQTKLEFRAFPSWSFGADRINFSGHLSWHIQLQKPDSYIQPFLWGQSYSYSHIMKDKNAYLSMHGGIRAVFNENRKKKDGTHIQLTWHGISREAPVWNSIDSIYEIKTKQNHYIDFSLKTSLFKNLTESSQEIKAEMNQNFGKASVSLLFREEFAETGYFELRFFAGSFLYKQLPVEEDHRFRLSGITGRNDYSYSLPYVSRSENTQQITTTQMYPGDGFFKTAVSLGQSWDWLTALNIRARIPGRIPVQLYFDIGTYKDAGTLYQGNTMFPWNGGITIQLWKDYFEIFIPLVMSKDIRDIYKLNEVNFFNRISWMIRLDEMNPFKFLKQ